MDDTDLIKSFLNGKTYTVEIPIEGSSKEIYDWCIKNSGEEGVDWRLIRMNGNGIVVGIFLDEEVAVSFRLTWE